MFKKIIDYTLGFSILLMLILIAYTFITVSSQKKVTNADDKHTVVIHGSTVETLLNDNYVFINLGPSGLPYDQGYMIDYVDNDTIYLIPNTEEAGY